MDGRYSLILMSDHASPVKRFDIPKRHFRNALTGAAVAAAIAAIGFADYVRVRIDHSELVNLRAEAERQRETIQNFEASLAEVDSKLARISDFERKVRIIANLPGSAGSGGGDVTEVGRTGSEVRSQALEAVSPAVGAGAGTAVLGPEPPPRTSAPATERVSILRRDAERLGLVADAAALSLADLLQQLEGKRQRLASSPSIWPAKGWLTSRYGSRVSPFTGQHQFHSGIDIAGERGTDIIASAQGVVHFAGTMGPLGRSVVLDHGFGLRTVYGHTREVFVKRGQTVERGDRIAALGSSGRSTGPHLHYTVELEGKPVNPLDYIFD